MRPPEEVMILKRMGASHPTRLSFIRILLRTLQQEKWELKKALWEMDARGVGRAVYHYRGPQRTYSLVAFSHQIKDNERSDRVIAQKWDATFALFDGIPKRKDIIYLEKNVPLQEAGRLTSKVICISRANKSLKFYQKVLSLLCQGKQPNSDEVYKKGYLMRTSAVYGSGKFGACVRESIANRHELTAPFQAEMLIVYLIRNFVFDLIDWQAISFAPERAVSLSSKIKIKLGIGNSTGLGMAPFLTKHPRLIHHWVSAKEKALQEIRSVKKVSLEHVEQFRKNLDRSQISFNNWESNHKIQQVRIKRLRKDIFRLQKHLDSFDFNSENTFYYFWDELYLWSTNKLSLEGQEYIVSLLIEQDSSLDHLSKTMHDPDPLSFELEGEMKVKQFFKQAQSNSLGNWVKKKPHQKNYGNLIWYVSAQKEEPRLGKQKGNPIYEQPVPIGKFIDELLTDLQRKFNDYETIAEFLLDYPQHRLATIRLQNLWKYPYSEIRENVVDRNIFPVNMLRFKLSFFGATHFDPRSDRWVRVSMFKNAPLPSQLKYFKNSSELDDWIYSTSE